MCQRLTDQVCCPKKSVTCRLFTDQIPVKYPDNHCHVLILAVIVARVAQSFADDEGASVYTQLVEISAKLDELSERFEQLEADYQQQNATMQDVAENNYFFSVPRDCADIRPHSDDSGLYTIYVGVMQRPLLVYCDMDTDGGGWTVFQRRANGSTDFYRVWNEYRDGFGNALAEFWLGNENIHWLTSNGRQYKLRIDLADFSGNSRYAEYDNFKVGSACSNYKLVSLGNYCGTAGDSFTYHVGSMFSTRDRDNDNYAQSCAVSFRGAWWYNACHQSNLNGYYYGGLQTTYADGINWYSWKGYYYSLRFTEMKIRPADV